MATTTEQSEARRASGTIRRSMSRSVRGTRSWVNRNAYQALGGLLVVPGLMFLPFAQGRWLMLTLALLLTLFNIALARLVDRRGGWTPWLSVLGFLAMVTAIATQPELFVACLVLLTANTAFVARSYGRKYAAGVLGATVPAVAGVAVWKGVPDIAGLLPLWLFAAFSTIGIIGESSEARRHLSKQYSKLIDGLGLVVWEGTVDRVEAVNEQAADLFGFSSSSLTAPGALRRLVHADDVHVLDFHREQVAAGRDHELRYRARAANGGLRWLMELVRVSPADVAGAPARVQGVIIDVSDRMEAEARAATYANLVESVGLGMLIVELPDPSEPLSLAVVVANPAMSMFSGASNELLSGRAVVDAFADVLDRDAVAALADVVRNGDTLEIGPVRIQPHGAQARYARLRAFPLPDGTAAVTFEDATAWQMANAALTYQANHDALTGMPNRSSLRHQLSELLDEATDANQSTTVLMIDLERFREVNANLGHHYGDRVLVEMARRLDGNSGGAAVLARLGGDEFVVVVAGSSARAKADRLANELYDVLSEPVEIDGLVIPITVTMGLATAPPDAGTAHDLLDRAEMALGVSKRSADRITHYDPTADGGYLRRTELLHSLREAIDSGDLSAHYQNVVDLRTGEIVGAESLVRWHHPEYGLLRPSTFIDLAEASGLVTPLTEYMASHAIADLSRWYSHGHRISMTLNISPRCLYDPDLVSAILGMLDEAELPPSALQFEVAERALLDDPVVAEQALSFLHQHGCAISIDDFGTGYSSLSLLRRLPIDELKIDRSFIDDLKGGDDKLVRSLIDLGHAFGARVVAEGVETPQVIERLADLGCDRVQGYVFGRPVPADEFAGALVSPPADVARHLGWIAGQFGESIASGGTVTRLAPRRVARRDR
jgi:diguanylate cyclase (GGDEF)-like protein/PAS domain S-box-containing protein